MRLGVAASRFRTAAHVIAFVAVALRIQARLAAAAAAAFARDRVGLATTPGNHNLLTRTSTSSSSPRPPSCGVTATAQGGRADEGDDLLKWERMYYQSEKTRPSSYRRSSDEDAWSGTRVTSQVRVVSFDLDNTVWRTAPTIASANDALSQFLQERHGVPSAVRVENIMKDLSQSDPGRYNPSFAAAVAAAAIVDEGASPLARPPHASPVLLTRLRKDAIRVALRDHGGAGAGGPDGDSHDEAAMSARIDRAFEHWVEARHDAISNHMADDAAACLSRIASMRTAEGHPVLIGAITDGNSDPSLVKALEPYFDFCVNAERVGVAKPDQRLYLEAAAIAASHPGVQAVIATRTGGATAEDTVGPWWVHVGDDFIKDVVAAKSLGMRSVWCRELVSSGSSSSGNDALTAPRDAPGAPSRSVEDLVKQVSEMKVVRMEVGADDYLAASLHDEFADAVVDRFSQVSTLLHEWHKEGLASHLANDEPAKDGTFGGVSLPLDGMEPTRSGASAERKFCMHCGTPLPAVAAFCSGCGQKQI